jgi:hypothetical protein
MVIENRSGQRPWEFIHRPDLNTLPAIALDNEVDLHGGFAVDTRMGFGQIYYGMPECGILVIESDLRKQHLIKLPSHLTSVNFHSTKIGKFDNNWRLFLAAEGDEQIIVLTLDGEIDFVLPRPLFEEYHSKEVPFKPTDTLLYEDQLYIADGYGANYISSANIQTKSWLNIFGGKTDDPNENGKFSTAHGLNLNPVHNHFDIADRPNSRIQAHDHHGNYLGSYKLPPGSWPCGINYLELENHWYAVVGCLEGPNKDAPAPIYILDANTYNLLSEIHPKLDLGIELADHLHNVVFKVYNNQLFLICQAWNPGHYFVLEKI